MSENEVYRHEDIEALLMSKAFDELLSEEREYVMQHVQNEQEYTALRSLLLEMHQLSFDAELKDPPESLETALFSGFAENAEKVRGYKQRFAPWMGWAVAASVIGFCVLFFWPKSERVETAEVEQKTDVPSTEPEKPSGETPKQTEPKPAVQIPTVVLPADVENLFAQVVQASTPEPPGFAENVYEYEDALNAVSLTEEAAEEPASAEEFSPAEIKETSAGSTVQEDVAMNAAPAAARAQEAETLSSTGVKTVTKISAETKALGKANRKKTRNPEVLKLSQSRKLKSFLRSE
jgi:hypothetical protein